ncbi:MAG: glycosyltransferase [Bacteroidota bacterium]
MTDSSLLYNLSGIPMIVLCCAGAAFVIQVFYFLFFYCRFCLFKPKDQTNAQEAVSVIICARNEDWKLEKFLPAILEQDYPAFEVIVVNDFSEDNTYYLLHDMAKIYPRLKIVHLFENHNFFIGKKFPLSIGIKSAEYDCILLTDADCIPKDKNWIASMQRNFTDKTEFVLGYGAYQKKKGLLNKLIRFDTFQIALQYFSYALAGIPYMGVGRNLGYRKKLFLESRGFTSHYNIVSGDDDLYVNQHAHGSNTRIEISPESHTISQAAETFKEWRRQKQRHLTTAKHYKFKHQILLTLFPFSLVIFYLSIVASAVLLSNLAVVGGLWLLRSITQLLVYKNSMRRLGEKDLLLFSPVFEIYFLFFYPITYVTNRFNKTRRWK